MHQQGGLQHLNYRQQRYIHVVAVMLYQSSLINLLLCNVESFTLIIIKFNVLVLLNN